MISLGFKSLTISPEIQAKWNRRKKISSVEWFEQNVKIPKKVKSLPGSWSKELFPYQVGPLDCFDDPEVREVSLQWGSQLGKTTIIQSLPSKIADTDPSPMIFTATDEKQAREVANERIMATAESVPTLKDKLLPKGRRLFNEIQLGDCIVYMAWSGSPATVGGRTCRYGFNMEVSKWSRKRTEEADSADLVRERLKMFYDSKIFYESTPTIKGICRIDNLGQAANQRLKFFVPCPRCSQYQDLKMGQIKWKKTEDGGLDRDLAEETAYYECEFCEYKIRDVDKVEMLQAGTWAEEKKQIENPKATINWTNGKGKRRVHFDLSSLYSPIITFGEVASEFIRCLKSGLQNFLNGWLAQTWTPNIKQYHWEKLFKKISVDIKKGYVASYVKFLTAGIDVQKDSAYFIVRGWGVGGRSCLVNWGQVTTFAELEKYLIINEYEQTKDRKFSVLLTGIDTGYRPYRCYNWTNEINREFGVRVRCIKGTDRGAPYWMNVLERSGADGKPIEGGIELWHLNDIHWKDFLTSKYDIEPGDPGAWEVSKDADERYMRGITAESLQKREDGKGNVKYEWVITDTGAGNHYLDCEKIAAAMAEMCGWRDLTDETPAGGFQQAETQEEEADFDNEFLRPDGDLLDRDTTL